MKECQELLLFYDVIDTKFRGVAHKITFNYSDQEDFIQEMWCSFWEMVERGRITSYTLPSIIQYCKRRAIDRIYRKGKSIDNKPRKDIVTNSLFSPDEPDRKCALDYISSNYRLEERIIEKLVIQALYSTLSQIQRETFELFFIEGYNKSQIARLRGVNEATVRESIRSILRKARDKLYL